MLTVDDPRALDDARQRAELSQVDLWLRYFALGGMAPALEVEAIVHGALAATDVEHDRIAHALNERLGETGRGPSVPYAEDETT